MPWPFQGGRGITENILIGFSSISFNTVFISPLLQRTIQVQLKGFRFDQSFALPLRVHFGTFAMAPTYCGPSPALINPNSTRMQTSESSEVTKNHKQVTGKSSVDACGWPGNLMFMMELRKKVLTFRDIIDLPPCGDSGEIDELVIGTIEDLCNLYPKALHPSLIDGTKELSIFQGLFLLYNTLKSVEDFWAKNHKWAATLIHIEENSSENISLEELGSKVLQKLGWMTRIARDMFDIMDEDNKNDNMIRDSIFGDDMSKFCSKITCQSPTSPTSIPPELAKLAEQSANITYSRPLLLPHRLQAVEKCFSLHGFSNTLIPSLSPTKEKKCLIDENQVKHQEKSNTIAPPAPPPPPQQAAPYPLPPAKGLAPPPPPPLGRSKSLRVKKANTKLKRSTHMSNLYQNLKRKVEGTNVNGKRSQGRKARVGGSAEGKQGMADALAEMTKRSAYFQQIEEDVQKHSKSIMNLKAAINSFQTKDMNELLAFHKHVEQYLEELSDETQVLARFEDFPMKKLESLRTAAALYLRLNEIVQTLQNWKIKPPLGQLLDKVDCYFNKIKGEIDTLERNKDEESKRFLSHNIHFNFNILVGIKESMVDVSSSCMELALKEKREAKAAANAESGAKTESKRRSRVITLWKAFQFAFRVYSFAGGHDDRADKLSKELAQEIENDPQHE